LIGAKGWQGEPGKQGTPGNVGAPGLRGLDGNMRIQLIINKRTKNINKIDNNSTHFIIIYQLYLIY